MSASARAKRIVRPRVSYRHSVYGGNATYLTWSDCLYVAVQLTWHGLWALVTGGFVEAAWYDKERYEKPE